MAEPLNVRDQIAIGWRKWGQTPHLTRFTPRMLDGEAPPGPGMEDMTSREVIIRELRDPPPSRWVPVASAPQRALQDLDAAVAECHERCTIGRQSYLRL